VRPEDRFHQPAERFGHRVARTIGAPDVVENLGLECGVGKGGLQSRDGGVNLIVQRQAGDGFLAGALEIAEPHRDRR
jgi:hypothetical protein